MLVYLSSLPSRLSTTDISWMTNLSWRRKMGAVVSQKCVCLLFSLDHFSSLSGYCRGLELDDNWTKNTDRPNSFQLVWMVCPSKTALDHAHHRFCDTRIRLDSHHFPTIPPLTHASLPAQAWWHACAQHYSLIDIYSTYIAFTLTAFPSNCIWLTLSRMQQAPLVPRPWVSSMITRSLSHSPKLFPGISIPFRVRLPIIWKTNVWCLRAGWWQLRKPEFRPTWNSYLPPSFRIRKVTGWPCHNPGHSLSCVDILSRGSDPGEERPDSLIKKG